MNIQSKVPVSRQMSEQPLKTAHHDLDIAKIWKALWRGRNLIAVFALLGAVLGAVYAFGLAPVKYKATTLLVMQKPNEIAINQDLANQQSATDLPNLNTELHIVRSLGMIEQLVERFDLVNDPEFNPARTDAAQPVTQFETEMVVQNVQNVVSAKVQRNTHIFSISVTSQDREKAAMLADALAELYLSNQIEAKFTAIEGTTIWLSDRVGVLQQDLRSQEDAITQLHASLEPASLDGAKLAHARMQEMRARVSDAQRRADDAMKHAAAFQDLRDAGDLKGLVTLTGDQTLGSLVASGSVEATAVDNRLNQIEAQLTSDMTRLVQKKTTLEGSLKQLEIAAGAQADGAIQLQGMEREAQATRVLYETLLARLKEASALGGLQQADARVLSKAVADYESPLKAVIVIACCLAGMFLAGAFVLAKQFCYSGFRSADELQGATGKPVLAQIPLMPINRRQSLLTFLADNPTAAGVEAMRDLRTSLLMSKNNKPLQVILSASAIPGEGKTTHSFALAHSFAGLGKRVLLVEGDIRRRTFETYLAHVPENGVISVTSGEVALEDAVYRDARLGIDILTGEALKNSAADIFASRGFDLFLQAAKEAYDIIIIDSPPVLVVPDAKVIAPHADAIVFAVGWNKSTRAQVHEGLRQFEMANCPVTGLVLSQVNLAEMARYGDAEANVAYGTFGDTYYQPS